MFSAKGANQNSLGQRPRKRRNKTRPSAESAIQSSSFLVHVQPVPQSLSKVILHIIFSTKDREPWLDSAARPRVHAYLATICRDLGGEVSCVGGVADHVHIVTTLPRALSQSELLERIKKPSSKWIKALEARYKGFFWQRGYGAFSVSPSQLAAVTEYVEKQEEHHRTHTFQEEYRELLHRHGVKFDEKYLWD